MEILIAYSVNSSGQGLFPAVNVLYSPKHHLSAVIAYNN